jgi:hypothetical protein
MSKAYVASLIKTGELIDESSTAEQPQQTTPTASTKFTELVGKAAWMSSKTRPDLSMAVAKLQQRTAKPTKEDIAASKHLLRYIKGTLTAHMIFGATGDGLIGYVDISFADNPDRKSTMGWVFFFDGTPISWLSKKQSVPAGSSTQAEYMAYEDVMREAIFLAKLARDLGLRPFDHGDAPKDPANAVPICTDSDNALILTGQTGYRRATRHYDIKWHIIRHGIKMGWVRLVMIPSQWNTADGLTKPLDKDAFGSFKEMLRSLNGFGGAYDTSSTGLDTNLNEGQ